MSAAQSGRGATAFAAWDVNVSDPARIRRKPGTAKRSPVEPQLRRRDARPETDAGSEDAAATMSARPERRSRRSRGDSGLAVGVDDAPSRTRTRSGNGAVSSGRHPAASPMRPREKGKSRRRRAGAASPVPRDSPTQVVSPYKLGGRQYNLDSANPTPQVTHNDSDEEAQADADDMWTDDLSPENVVRDRGGCCACATSRARMRARKQLGAGACGAHARCGPAG